MAKRDIAENPTKPSFFQSFFQKRFSSEIKTRDALNQAIREAHSNGVIDQNTCEMIDGVIGISDLRVRDLMVPRSQITFIDEKFNLNDCVNTIIESTHSRFPVVNDEREQILGILHGKDLLHNLRSNGEEFDLKSILRPASIVPESKRVDTMLKDFRLERFHMAIVVDEFGAVSGLITIEDILEQIVGDIEDEFDEDGGENILQLSRHTYKVSALTNIEDFNQTFHCNFADEEVDTVGGLIIQAFGYLPKRGEEITLDGIKFKVKSGNSRRITQLQVTIPESTPSELCE